MRGIADEEVSRLGTAGLRAYINIAKAWGLSESEAAQLLGVSATTYRHWRDDPERAHLSEQLVERLSLILGIYKLLQTLLPREDAADSWVRRSNANPLFASRPPLDLMLSPDMSELMSVRRYLEGQAQW